MYVKDRQLNKSWNFIYNDWLAVDRGSLMHTSATLDAVTEEEMKFKQKHNFMVKSTNDLRDSHLWLSIFSKPARSTFTRVQRLTCALSLLLTTMLTNIMFYGIPTDDPEDQAGTAGGITVSLSAIVIGIESSLIMFPVNLLILQLFLKVKPKPPKYKVQASPESYKVFQKMYEAGSKMTHIVLDKMMEKLEGPQMPHIDISSHDQQLGDDAKRTESFTTNGMIYFKISEIELDEIAHYENTLIQIILKISQPKLKKIQMKNSDVFHISAQYIDCGYSLELPQ